MGPRPTRGARRPGGRGRAGPLRRLRRALSVPVFAGPALGGPASVGAGAPRVGTSGGGARSTWAERLTLAWLAGTLVLLPIDLIVLPLNMNLVDIWFLLALPLLALSALRGSHVLSWLYVVPMWLILLGSLLSTFGAPIPRNSLIVILKETYVFVWFFTLTLVLARLRPAALRRVLVVWLVVVLGHGAVIVAEFASPAVWRAVAGLGGRAQVFDVYRPTGLFVNANSAAFFQLLGFVPLVLVRPARRRGLALAGVLLATMLATGSMGAAVALVAGLVVVLGALVLTGKILVVLRLVGRMLAAATIFAMALAVVVAASPRYQHHLQEILIGRADRSSEGRFDLWQRGLDVFVGQRVLVWGVGPENFRAVDGHGKQLHNDFMAFLVERGLLGVLGLGAFAALAAARASLLAWRYVRDPERVDVSVVVFLGAVVAAGVESLTHQTFHFRELWLVLALQEAVLYRLARPHPGPAERSPYRLVDYRRGFAPRPDLPIG